MPYRDDLEAAEHRAARLEGELVRVRREQAGSGATIAALEREVEQAWTAAYVASLPALDDVRVARPCDERWDAMPGDDRVRHCGRCCNQVFNLSAMSRDQADRLLRRHGASICVRFYRRWDGTVMTDDCRLRALRLATYLMAAGVSAILIAVVLFAAFASPPNVTMGLPAAPPSLEQPP